jgi:hypothetical protein
MPTRVLGLTKELLPVSTSLRKFQISSGLIQNTLRGAGE